jgi:hypothetical protein
MYQPDYVLVIFSTTFCMHQTLDIPNLRPSAFPFFLASARRYMKACMIKCSTKLGIKGNAGEIRSMGKP